MGVVGQYYQCQLSRGHSVTVGWVEARAAKAGHYVELLPEHEFWRVDEVYTQGMPKEVLKEHQRLNRNSLLSVEPMGAPPKQVGEVKR